MAPLAPPATTPSEMCAPNKVSSLAPIHADAQAEVMLPLRLFVYKFTLVFLVLKAHEKELACAIEQVKIMFTCVISNQVKPFACVLAGVCALRLSG